MCTVGVAGAEATGATDPPFYTCQPINRSRVDDFCAHVPLPARVCVDPAGWHYGRDAKGYAKQAAQCSSAHKAKKTCPNAPSYCKAETLTKAEYCGEYDQSCERDADCNAWCYADCFPCNDAADCDILADFGVLAQAGDTKCFSLKNHTA